MFHTAMTRRPSFRALPVSRDPFFNLVDRFFGESAVGNLDHAEAGAERTWMPPVDIMETDAAIVATVDLPGLTKEDINLSLENDVLTLSGQRTYETSEDTKVRRVERAFGSFTRTFNLPRGIDGTKVSAKFENGVLSLTLPKSEVAQVRKIEIA